ncbi:DUF1592 domain-containing protein [Sinimarinibacterium thermocellulolyticum]|uniref:DUF1592 domain-containing protein n=1 Tax=Sinimarinibacterium thermocellulolyticum TaxID=3170016 RepID=A0ABV2ABE2_9GAMM
MTKPIEYRDPPRPRLVRACLVLAGLAALSACGGNYSGHGEPEPGSGGIPTPVPTLVPTPAPSATPTATPGPGGDTDAALQRGAQRYAQQCASCHGARGQGGVGPALTDTTNCPSCASFDTLWTRIRDTMPSSNPRACDEACARDVAAFILNGFSTTPPAGGAPTPTPTASPAPGSTPTPTPTAAPTPTPSATPPPPTPTCSAEFKYQSVWNTGFVAEVTVRNFSGARIDGWQVQFTFPNDQRITNDWNTVLTQSGAAVSALPERHNAAIENGASVSFGFQGTHGGKAEVPTDLRLEAAGCVVAAPPPDHSGSDPIACAEQPAAPRLLRLLTRREYAQTVRDLTGLDGDFTANLPIEALVQGYDNNACVAVVTERHAEEYLEAAEAIAARAVAERRDALLPCAPTEANCARRFVEAFGLRAFRRPLLAAERDALVALFDAELSPSFDEGMALAIAAMLNSPAFLYRSELGTDIGGGVFRLDDYEIASSLSYLIWGSAPDAALLDAAAAGRLRDADERRSQAERMLADPRARQKFADFATQWLGTGYLLGSFKDPEIFPRLTDEVRRAMAEELSRFVNHVAFDSADGTLTELYTADYVFVNGPLRDYYGLPGSSSDANFVQQPAGSQRGGLLGLGAVLAAHAHSNESSPIKRGVFVRERLLCQDLPDPPPDVDTTPPGLDPNLTTRERFARHTADPGCAACHRYIDDTGFGLEAYDGAGGYRATENGQPVDDRGELFAREGLNTNTRDPFRGPRQLAQILAGTSAAQRCAVTQYYRYSHGYVETEADRCLLEALQTRFADGGYRLKTLITDWVGSDEFILRRGTP